MSPLPEILINGRFATQRTTGVQRYARETLLQLDELIGRGEGRFARWTLAVPPEADAPRLQHIAVEPLGPLRGHLWEQWTLARRARRAALLYSPGFTGPWLCRHGVVTIHDAAVVRFPQNYTRAFRAWYRWLIPQLTRRAPLTFAVSRFSAHEAVACFGVPRERLQVGTEGWQHLDRQAEDEAILDALGLRDAPFLLAVSSLTPNKNFQALVDGLAALGAEAPRCVVAGAIDEGVFRQAPALLHERIVRAGYVSDGQLKALYRHATGFVMPSLYEGFGIPPLEAMALGCPVIASTAPALVETCADAALYFDPHQPEQLAGQILRLVREPALQAQLRQAGHHRARSFSWAENARRHLQAMERALHAVPAASLRVV